MIAFMSAGVGEWLSLVEHLVRDQGVGGSNPLSPTNYLNPVIELAKFPNLDFLNLGPLSGPILLPKRKRRNLTQENCLKTFSY